MTNQYVTFEEAAQMMSVPVTWVQGMVEKNELAVEQTANGPAINADEIKEKGWNIAQTVCPSYGSIMRQLVATGLRTMH